MIPIRLSLVPRSQKRCAVMQAIAEVEKKSNAAFIWGNTSGHVAFSGF